RAGEARPAAPGVELGVRAEQLGATAGAQVLRRIVAVPVRPRECALGPLLPEHVVLLGRQLATPLLVRLGHLVAHGVDCYSSAGGLRRDFERSSARPSDLLTSAHPRPPESAPSLAGTARARPLPVRPRASTIMALAAVAAAVAGCGGPGE